MTLKDSFANFNLESFPYKLWKIKDTYVVTPITEGSWWPLKKYLVIYVDILVNRREIDKKSLIRIYKNFEVFVNSFPDELYKKRAHDYFLKNFNPDNIMEFKDFCDVDDYEDTARKFYFMKLMGVGGQAGLKNDIKLWLEDNKTLSEIIKQIPLRQDYYIKNNLSNKVDEIKILIDGKPKKISRSVIDKKGNKISLKTVLSDFHASLTRNQRQVYSKWGFLPLEKDGIISNQITDLIYNCKSEIELISICDHQKLKLREGNPYSDKMINYKPKLDNKIKFNRSKLEKDFYVSPFISLMEVFNKLSDLGEEDWYVSIYEYQYIIAKITPFNADDCVKLILDYRRNNQIDESKLDRRKKRREITENKVSGGNIKALTSLLYGYISTNKKDNDFRSKNTKAFLIYENKKFKIIDFKAFKKYFEIIIKCKDYLNNTYKNLYKKISDDYEIMLKKEILDHELFENYKKDLISPYKNMTDDDTYDFIKDYLHSWSNYIQCIDTRLLEFCFEMNSLVLPYKSSSRDIHSLEKDNEDKINILSYSTIKSLIERSGYEILGLNNLKKNRNDFNKIKPKIWKDREEGVFHRKKFDLINIDKCDACFDTAKLELHHIINHEINGPDVDLNLVYLCKSCHNKFTFNTKKESEREGNSRLNVINNLKKRHFISFKNFNTLINEGLITQLHLDFLFPEYISYVEKIALEKTYRIKQKKEEKSEEILSRFQIKNDRWSRSMRAVLKLRKNNYFINGKIDFHYPVDKCDGGCGNKIEECHHVIPKSGSNNRQFREEYGNLPLNGPESEYNYVYLCKECHLKFTNHDPERIKIIEEIKNRRLISYQGVLMMMYSDLIGEKQISFLYKEGFIDESDFDNLIMDFNDYQQNQLN